MLRTELLVLYVGMLAAAAAIEKIAPSQVRNDRTNELYNHAIVNPMIKDLTDFVAGIRDRRYSYVPDDVALVQTISSLQATLFQLAAFYSLHEEGYSLSKFEKGVGIVFESHRCDNVYSSKFPRERPTTLPWVYYRDSSYYRLNCELPKYSSRKRRSADDIFQHESSRRSRRAIPVVKNTSPLCGTNFAIKENSGTLMFPVNSTGNYTTNMVCQWTIEVAPNYAVYLTFDKVQLEYDKKCHFDSLAFYEGNSDQGTLIGKICGEMKPIYVKSRKKYMTIKFTSDNEITGEGFSFNWTLTQQVKEHPGFVVTSTIVVDQVGDLKIDTMDNSDFQKLKDEGLEFSHNINKDFVLRLTNPSTCPIESNDLSCFFETKPYIISKIVGTGVNPNYQLPSDSIEVIFDHALQHDLYPDLYDAPKFCVTWDSSVKNTAYGSWTRKNGIVKETNLERTICRFSATGIHAVAAVVPPPVIPDAFRFSRSWYFGLVFAVIWIFVTFANRSSRKVNIPNWLNMNQLVALLVFCGIMLSGIHLELHKTICSVLSFLLYYFGLSVFVWHLLKAAQFTGAFDKFFRRERNLYAFYLLLGWGVPFFIAGMAAGAKLYVREKTQSCWMAMKGGTIWGYTSPTYFIVLAICFLYYKGLKKTKIRLEIYNYPRMRQRAIKDAIALIFFILTWITGMLCMTNETKFAPQFFFSLCLSCTVVVLCLNARQKRRSFEKAFDWEDMSNSKNKHEEHRKFLEEDSDNEEEAEHEKKITELYVFKWRFQRRPYKLHLALKIKGLDDPVVVKNFDKYEVKQKESEAAKWNAIYTGITNEGYDDDDDDNDDRDNEDYEDASDPEENDNEEGGGSDDENDSEDEDKGVEDNQDEDDGNVEGEEQNDNEEDEESDVESEEENEETDEEKSGEENEDKQDEIEEERLKLIAK